MICENGNHNLEVVYRLDTGWDVDHIIRWCSNCGAIVVDAERDNRTYAGKIMPMRFINK